MDARSFLSFFEVASNYLFILFIKMEILSIRRTIYKLIFYLSW